MEYKRIYNAIILNRQTNPVVGYSEEHHIIPRCLGGEDIPTNLVRLSAREHFLCHHLLCKMYERTSEYYKLVKAFGMMLRVHSRTHKRHSPSHTYAWFREAHSQAMSASQSGCGNSSYGTMWITNGSDNARIRKWESIPDGWQRGRDILGSARPAPLTEDQKLERESLRRLKLSESNLRHNAAKGRFWITDGALSKRVPPGSHIPVGWRRGRIMPT